MKEDLKQLLLKDLCSRLPYGIYVGDKYGNKWKLVGIETYANTVIFKQKRWQSGYYSNRRNQTISALVIFNDR